MKFWKVITLIALAVVPFLFHAKEKEEEGTRPEVGDVDNIFEEELSAQ